VERLHLSNILDFIWTWTQARNQGGRKIFFRPIGKTCWTLFETIEHGSKNVGPSQKSFRPSWCPKLVTGLLGL